MSSDAYDEAMRLSEEGRYEEALDRIEAAKQHSTPTDLLGIVHGEASVLEALGRHREALAVLREARRLSPDKTFRRTLKVLQMILRVPHVGRIRAFWLYTSVLRLSRQLGPDYRREVLPYAEINRALLLYELHLDRLAVRAIREALRWNVEQGPCLAKLGAALVNLRRNEEAAEALLDALRFELSEALKGSVHLYLYVALRELGRTHLAQHHLQESAKLGDQQGKEWLERESTR